jgi:hypothetical protein
MKFQV